MRSHPLLLSIVVAAALTASAAAALLIDPTGGTKLFSDVTGADDEVAVARPLGFTFSYFGDAETAITTVDVAVNGNLNFSGDSAYANAPLPTETARISPLWDDLKVLPGTGDGIVEKKLPGTYYSVTWTVHAASNPLSRHVFQVVLFAKKVRIGLIDFLPGDIAFAYGELGFTLEKGSATVGLDSGDGDAFATLPSLVSDTTAGMLPQLSAAMLLQNAGGLVLFRPVEDEGGYSLPLEANAPPEPEDDTGYSDGTLSRIVLPVLQNDADPDGNPLAVLSVTQGSTGTVTINADGSLNYRPGSKFDGTDEFSYTVLDGLGGIATSMVRIVPFSTARGSYAGPLLDEGQLELGRLQVLVRNGGRFHGKLIVGDDAAALEFDGAFDAVGQYSGTVTDAVAETSYEVTLHLGFVNGANRITGTVDDGSAPATLLAVRSANSPPFATDDVVYLRGMAPVAVRPLANDSDADGDSLSITAFTQGTSGSVSQNPDGSLTYAAASAVSGGDRFIYTATDSQGLSSTAQVTVIRLAEARGIYQGLIMAQDEDGMLLPAGAGHLRLMVSATGSFTGTVWYGGSPRALRGSFDETGSFAMSLGGSPVLQLSLHLDLTKDMDQITGTITTTDGTSTVAIGRSRFQARFFPAPQAGAYTMLLPPDVDGPQGTGWARVVIGKAGQVVLAGKLGDGARLSLGATLQVNGFAAIYAPLRFPGTRPFGFLLGSLRFDAPSAGSNVAGTLTWMRPPKDDEDDQTYTVSLAATGAMYVAPKRGELLLDVGAQLNNLDIAFGDGSVAATLATSHRVMVDSTDESGLIVTLFPKTGLFVGSFLEEAGTLRNGDPRRVRRPFSGALVRPQKLGAGVYVGTDGAGSITLGKLEADPF